MRRIVRSGRGSSRHTPCAVLCKGITLALADGVCLLLLDAQERFRPRGDLAGRGQVIVTIGILIGRRNSMQSGHEPVVES